MLKYRGIKIQKDMVFMVCLILIQYYMFHSALLAFFLILIL